jgi:hypothetical protein
MKEKKKPLQTKKPKQNKGRKNHGIRGAFPPPKSSSKHGFFSNFPSKVDGTNVFLLVCQGGIFVFGPMISIGYPNFI